VGIAFSIGLADGDGLERDHGRPTKTATRESLVAGVSRRRMRPTHRHLRRDDDSLGWLVRPDDLAAEGQVSLWV
jgi:hypothetical protein